MISKSKMAIVKLDSAKTGKVRYFPLKESLPHLERLKKESTESSPDDFIFPAPKTEGKYFSVQNLEALLKSLAKKAKIKKHIFPYLIRHSRLNFLKQKLPGSIYEKVAGHSIKVASDFYDDLASDEVIEVMNSNVYQTAELPAATEHKLQKEVRQLKKVIERLTAAVSWSTNTAKKDVLYELQKIDDGED